MPAQSFSLETGQPERLNISWRPQFKKVFVSLDGNTIGVVHDKKELLAGQDFFLPDGSTIRIQLVNILTESELRVLRNGKPLPGSASDPRTRLKRAYQAISTAGWICIVISLLNALFAPESFWRGDGFSFFLITLVLMPLGFLVRRKSMLALGLAIIIWLGLGILAFVLEDHLSVVRVCIWIYSLSILLVPMVRGIGALQALKAEPE